MTVTNANATACCCDESGPKSQGGGVCRNSAVETSDPSSPSSNHGSCHDRISPSQSLEMQGRGKRTRSTDDGDEVSQGIVNKRSKGNEEDEVNDDDDPHIGKLSREAEAFALQAIHTSLLKKMSEVGRVLAGVMKENRIYKKVLRDHMGQNEEDIKRVIDIQIMRAMRTQKAQTIGNAEATVIAAAALGKNLNSPADAMQDILKLFRYAPSLQSESQAAKPAATTQIGADHAIVASQSNSASEGTRA